MTLLSADQALQRLNQLLPQVRSEFGIDGSFEECIYPGAKHGATPAIQLRWWDPAKTVMLSGEIIVIAAHFVDIMTGDYDEAAVEASIAGMGLQFWQDRVDELEQIKVEDHQKQLAELVKFTRSLRYAPGTGEPTPVTVFVNLTEAEQAGVNYTAPFTLGVALQPLMPLLANMAHTYGPMAEEAGLSELEFGLYLRQKLLEEIEHRLKKAQQHGERQLSLNP